MRNEEKFTQVEEERTDALEMAAQENEKGKAQVERSLIPADFFWFWGGLYGNC